MAELIRVDEELQVPDQLPVIALRDLVFFPYMVLPLLIGRPRSVAALREARQVDDLALLVAQKRAEVAEPGPDDVHSVGTVVRLVQSSQLPDGTSRVVMEGLGRARVTELVPPGEPGTGTDERGLKARIELLVHREAEGDGGRAREDEALVRQLRKMFGEYAHLHPQVPDELSGTLADVDDAVRMVHLMSGHLLGDVPEKQALLEQESLRDQLAGVREMLGRELEILRIEEKLDAEIQDQIETGRKKHYLQEQLKAIHKELDVEEDEWTELERALDEAELPERAHKRADRELERLRQLNPVAPEAAVIRTYLDWIVHLPWSKTSRDNLDVEHAGRVLDEAHYGLDEVKERILDHIAVLSMVGSLQGPILCLVGPPGVGKTSLGRSIARALNREFVRASLGGLRDEAEIRGHRRTYVGALPGRIVQGMRRSGTRNPVFLLDEVDKLARDFHGDPGAALLEVLDPEQNDSFTDHYLELAFDLSDVLFVATANTLGGIPDPLRDRMEVIRIPGYLETEKRAIARRFLWPEQARRHGLEPDQVEIDSDALQTVIHRYTREAGVRDLDRRIGRIARKVARRIAVGDLDREQPVHLREDALKDLLGPPTHSPPSTEDEENRTGIANGLAWTRAGGEVLNVEVAVVPGSGQIQLTGTLGEVMKESAFAALTYARSRAHELGLEPTFHEDLDIHIHIPEGATPKDGPSAGITIAVALISALTGTPTRPEVAMTGEITLRGRVLGVGGIKEKAVAALRTGVTTVLLPREAASRLEELPDEVRRGLTFRSVGTMDEVLAHALRRAPDASAGGARTALNGGADAGIQVSG